MIENRPITFGEALSLGYKKADMQYQLGYVRRRNFDLNEARLHVAGGHRKGELYALAPCYNTSRFCLRVYLKKED